MKLKCVGGPNDGEEIPYEKAPKCGEGIKLLQKDGATIKTYIVDRDNDGLFLRPISIRPL